MYRGLPCSRREPTGHIVPNAEIEEPILQFLSVACAKDP
jgi:hypothetical protein